MLSTPESATTRVSWQFFVDAYRKALGVEQANALLEEVVSSLGMRRMDSYDPAEANQIIDCLKQKEGLVKVIATVASTRLILSGQSD